MNLFEEKTLNATALAKLVDQVLVDQGYLKGESGTYLVRTARGGRYLEDRTKALHQLLRDAVVGHTLRRARERMGRPETTFDTSLQFEISLEKCREWKVEDFNREIRKELKMGSTKSIAVTLYKEKERFLEEEKSGKSK